MSTQEKSLPELVNDIDGLVENLGTTNLTESRNDYWLAVYHAVNKDDDDVVLKNIRREKPFLDKINNYIARIEREITASQS